MKKMKLLSSFILSLTVFMLSSCADFINQKNGYKVPYPHSEIRKISFEQGQSKYFELNKFISPADWNEINWKTQAIQIHFQGTPQEDIESLIIHLEKTDEFGNPYFDLLDWNNIIAYNLKKDEKADFTVYVPIPLTIYKKGKHIIWFETRYYTGNDNSWQKDTDWNFSINDCLIELNIVEPGFIMTTTNWNINTYRRAIHFSEFAETSQFLSNEKYVNVDLSFSAPKGMNAFSLHFANSLNNSETNPYNEASICDNMRNFYRININEGSPVYQFSSKIDFFGSVPDKGYPLSDCQFILEIYENNNNQGDNGNSNIVTDIKQILLSDFSVAFTVSDTPLYQTIYNNN